MRGALRETDSRLRQYASEQGWGSGFLCVNEELADYGAKSVAIEDAGVVTRLNVYRTSHARKGDEPNEPNEPNREPNEPKDTAQIILATFAGNPAATIPNLMDACHVSRATIKRALKTLKDTGCIRRKGGTRGVWEVLV